MEIPEYSDDGEVFYDAGEECSLDDQGAAKDLKESPSQNLTNWVKGGVEHYLTLCAHYHAAFRAHLH
jgi:hypothetical protein